MERLGLVGAGLMGEGIGASALRKGFPLAVAVHRNRAPIERLIAAGAVEVASLAALAAASDVIVICVSDAPTVEAVINTLLPDLRAGQLIIDVTTSDPVVSQAIAAQLSPLGAAFADAPVTGGPPQANQGQLATMLGCDAAIEDRVRAIASAWSVTIRRFGDVGAGNGAKLINNFVTQGTAALLAEAYTTARRAGLDWRALHAVQSNGNARSGTFTDIIDPAIDGNFDGAPFSLANSAKDARYYERFSAGVNGGSSPLACAVSDALARFVEGGYRDAFISRMIDPDVADSPALVAAPPRRSV